MVITAQWLFEKLRSIGMEQVEIIPTEGHPVVYAEWLKAGNNAPTVLIYGHYDVQPPDPINMWKTSPFQPVEQGEFLCARGSSDMKGQILATISAVDSILRQGNLPVNVKFILEGEEEIGSPHLGYVLEKYKDKLESTVALNIDAGMISPDIPTIVYGLRGLAYFEITFHGPDHDLHSGQFGGVVQNPANALCKVIAGMHDGGGHITLPGYYDDVLPISEQEKKIISGIPTDDIYYLTQTGSNTLWGESGFSVVERVGSRPTLDVNGLLSGFTAEGSKTVIPSWAMAKISMRLVPNQKPKNVECQLRKYLEMNTPNGIKWELSYLGGGPASMSDMDNPAVKAMAEALNTIWNRTPVFKREGGSIPIVADMQRILNIDSVLTGFGLPSDNIHSPNEHLHLPTWRKGILALIHFFYNYGENLCE